MADMTISISLASKLANIAVHADELCSPAGHTFDVWALRQVAHDPEVLAMCLDAQLTEC